MSDVDKVYERITRARKKVKPLTERQVLERMVAEYDPLRDFRERPAPTLLEPAERDC